MEVLQVLSQLLKNTGYTYKINGNYVIIVPEEVKTVKGKKQVSGVIVDTNGDPVIGANVVEKGTTNGTITDLDGKFTLEVNDNSVLQVSYIGYNTQEVSANGKTSFSIKLGENTQTLDEVVVVGYGTMKKSDLTGSVTNVKAEKLLSKPVVNVGRPWRERLPVWRSLRMAVRRTGKYGCVSVVITLSTHRMSLCMW